jgi:aminoglycoside phosphotransferase (APT) family kinase protein
MAGTGIANAVWLTPSHVIRLNSGRFREAFAYEAEVLRRLPAEIPRPGVLAHGKRADAGEFLVLERLPGVTIEDAWPSLSTASRRAVVRELADIVRRLHALAPAAWMDNPWVADAMAGRYADAYHAPPSLFRKLIGSARRVRPDASDVLARTHAFIAARIDAFVDDRDVPVHTDLHFRNVLVDGDRISGLIDFEGFRLAPADTELDMLLRSIRWVLASPGAGSMDHEMVPRWFREEYPALFAHPRLIERLEVYEALWHLVQLHWHPVGGAGDPVRWLERLLQGEFRSRTIALLG